MKLERLHEYVLTVVAMSAGLGFAVFCGHLVGEGRTGILLLMLYGIFFMALLLMLKEHIWVFIPMTWALAGQVPELPLPFAVRDLAVISVFGGFLLLKAFKVTRQKPSWELQDVWGLVILLYLGSSFIRNPVGVDALGSDRVGGRPYFNVIIASLAYWVLARVTISSEKSRLLPLFMLFGPLLEGSLSFVSYNFPFTAPLLSRFYSTVSMDAYNATDLRSLAGGESANRHAYLMIPGWTLVRAQCAWFRPLTLINPLYVVRFLFFLAGIACILVSGFRSGFLMAGVMFILSSYFRRGVQESVRLVLFALPVLVLILAMQGRVFDLPFPAQRALSFLPGKWDRAAVSEAQASTEWRVKMWRVALETDKYIQNKILGDGFGFTKRELDTMHANELSGSVEDGQENLLISGGVHSGPVSAIRFVGVIGLVMFLGLMIVMARDSWRLILRSKDTYFFPACLFIGVPIIWEPFHYTFVFGGFEGALPNAVVNLGLLKLLRNSMDAEAVAAAREPQPRREGAGVLSPARGSLAPAGVSLTAGLRNRPLRSS